MKGFLIRLYLNYKNNTRKRYFQLLSNRVNIIGKPIIRQPVHFVGAGKITFGKNSELGYFPSPYFYSGYTYFEVRDKNAEIIIGDRVISNNNLVIIAENGKIEIGNDVLIGSNVEIINSDFHHIDPQKRKSNEHKARNIIIKKNVFIGSNVKICKGVVIGKNSVIANGSVVFDAIPDNVIAKGNPAVAYKKINL